MTNTISSRKMSGKHGVNGGAVVLLALLLSVTGTQLCFAKHSGLAKRARSYRSNGLIFVALGGMDSAGHFVETFRQRVDDGFTRIRDVGATPPCDRTSVLTTDPSGRYLYMVTFYDNIRGGVIADMDKYSIARDGRIRFIKEYSVNLKDSDSQMAASLTFDPIAPFAYLQTEGHIVSYRVNNSGDLILIQSLAMNDRLYCAFIPPSAKLLYAGGYNSLWVYSIGKSGRVRQVGHPVIHSDEIENDDMTSTPDGRNLYVGAIDKPRSSHGLLFHYRCLPTGSLTSDVSTPRGFGTVIDNLETTGDGRFMYLNADEKIYAAPIMENGELGQLVDCVDSFYADYSTFWLDKKDGYLYYVEHKSDSDFPLYRVKADGRRPTRREFVGTLESNARQILFLSR